MRMLLTLIVQLGGDEERTITAIGQDLTEVAAMRAMQERKTRITAVLGHELRSPLHGIMGLSGSMADGAANPDQKRQLSMIKGCAGRLLDLVTNIMEMAKSEKLDSAGAAEAREARSCCVVLVSSRAWAGWPVSMTTSAGPLDRTAAWMSAQSTRGGKMGDVRGRCSR